MLRRLGIPQFGKWLLDDTVVPVALVDTSIVLPATSLSPLYGVPSTAGELVAPAANTRLADTGQLAAGNWTVMAMVMVPEANTFRLRRRNAADAADIWSQRFGATAGAGAPTFVFVARFSVAQNERFVVENVGAGGGGVVYQANLFLLAG